MDKLKNRILTATALAAIFVGMPIYGLVGNMGGTEENFIFVRRTDTPQVLREKISQVAPLPQRLAFYALASMTGYYDNIRPGRYNVGNGTPTLTVFRHMRNGIETPVRLTLPSTLRTVDDLAEFLGEHLEPTTDDFRSALTDKDLIGKFGLTPQTATCIFLPNTYEIYYSSTVESLMERMERESNAFWTDERTEKLQHIASGFTREQAITLASIVEQETQNNAERPAVAGMYINRLTKGMPLQADPTVKFAVGDFTIKRIMHKHLEIDSPYNTYRVAGLPPGPICIPSLASIDAVLNYDHHNYLYMCAKEDFSGTHNFAATYAEHLQNAHRYANALNERGIK